MLAVSPFSLAFFSSKLGRRNLRSEEESRAFMEKV